MREGSVRLALMTLRAGKTEVGRVDDDPVRVGSATHRPSQSRWSVARGANPWVGATPPLRLNDPTNPLLGYRWEALP